MSWKPEPTGILQQAFCYAYKTMGPGLCLEFGVGMGHSYCWQALQMQEWAEGCTLIGFDSFEGLPKETEGVWAPERHGEGCFCYPEHILHEHMLECGVNAADPAFRTVKGFYEDTLTAELQAQLTREHNLMFVNIDVDIHKSTLEALDFIRPMMRPGLPIYLDDYRAPIDDLPGAKDPSITEWGENLAWREWTEQNDVSYTLGDTNNLNQRYYIIQ